MSCREVDNNHYEAVGLNNVYEGLVLSTCIFGLSVESGMEDLCIQTS